LRGYMRCPPPSPGCISGQRPKFFISVSPTDCRVFVQTLYFLYDLCPLLLHIKLWFVLERDFVFVISNLN
jgi:hypothetical protein